MNVLDICDKMQCSQAELARFLNISRATVNVWARNKKIPLARQYQIKDLLDGRSPLGVEPYHTPESVCTGGNNTNSQGIDLSEIDDETKAFLSDF